MKKIFSTIITLALAAFVFTSCEDVPAPYNLPGEGGSEEGGATEIVAKGTGTLADPYNIAGVLEATANLETGANMPEKIAFKGIVTTLKECSKQYGNATFYLGDEENSTKTFYVYRCLGINNKNVTADDLVQEGDEVTVYGTITNYNGTIETSQKGAYIVKIVRNGEVIAASDGAGEDTPGEVKGTGTKDDPYNVAAAIKKCQETGETETSVEYYVKGLASTVDESGLAQYGNINIDMVDNGSDAVFKAFQIYSFNGKKFTASSGIKAGDEVVVKGKLVNYKNNTPETVGKGAACLVSVNGKGGEGSDTPDTPPTEATEITCAKAVEICNALEDKTETTKTYTVTGYITDTDGKISRDQQVFWMADTKDGGKVFEAYWANIPDPTKALPVGTKLKMTGKLMRYGSTPEMKNGNVVVLEMGEGGSGNESGNDNPGTGGASLADFTNGDFEQWSGSTPVNWKSACTASSATLAQSTDAHGGSYAVIVKGNTTQNKRLAYKELTLEAGTYTFSFYAKATSANAAQVRPGYVPVTDNTAGTYTYGEYATLSTSWTKVTHEFTLTAKTTICLVVMNPKASSYSSGEDVLIDDASIVLKSSAKPKRVRR